ncbi:hypothetical protein [Actinomadura latina]|uniref:Uncharacterized protein n=1 Tax=Actinomadura latina TaxID=163603 RepID=A0A846YQS5_9ACTN|nr:hypothetical protein [Actinomadura latina]NKZ02491.1 hypothetical protein [Actinomadura latina]
MQCPTCGNDTPGTLGKCSHCAAPIDVYSVGPAVPLAAPVADASPGAGTADALGDRTMMVPPPTPSWAPSPQPPAMPDLPTPPQQPPSPLSTAPEPPGQPPLRLSVEPSAATPASPLQPVDPEDTAAWTFVPDEDSGAYGAVPPAPGWGNGQPALPANEKPALPAAGGAEPNRFGLGDQPPPTESIVPESWFAQPRKPEGADADATQVWGGQGGTALQPNMQPGMQPGMQPAQPPAMPNMDATQIAPGPMNPGPGPQGFGGNVDQTRMDPGMVPMGAPPMGAPMGPMGSMGQPGMAPMGAMGSGGPGYGGFPPHQPQGPKSGGPSKPLIAAVAALVTVAVGAVVFVAWPSGDGSTGGATPSTTPSSKQVAQKNAIPPETKQQAAVLNKILNDSVDTRRILAGALGRAGKCKTLPQAIQGFQTVAQRRQNQLSRTKNLKVDKLAKGEQLRGTLSEALTASLQVDVVLLKWAQANQRNCHGKPKPSAAQVPGRAAQERRATTAKKQFVVLWNPVAKKTDQPQRSWKRV